jgi:Zn-dependent membrane protease YugP
MFWDPTLLLLIPGLLLAVVAQMKVSSAYSKYSRIGTQAGLTGAEVAARILRDANVAITGNPQTAGAMKAVAGIEPIGGQMTDHYDPSSRTLRLSEDVYNGQSIAALGIAAHEVGHAIQHSRAYAPLLLRGYIYPTCAFGEWLSFPILLAGMVLGNSSLVLVGILLFSVVVAFTLITLPVEFDASRRAILALERGGYLAPEELRGAKKVLNAAALTYVAAALSAILTLARLIIVSRRD